MFIFLGPLNRASSLIMHEPFPFRYFACFFFSISLSLRLSLIHSFIHSFDQRAFIHSFAHCNLIWISIKKKCFKYPPRKTMHTIWHISCLLRYTIKSRARIACMPKRSNLSQFFYLILHYNQLLFFFSLVWHFNICVCVCRMNKRKKSAS